MSKGREFESQYSILDVHFSHLFAVKLYCVFERTKINEKEAGVGPFLKKELKCSIDLWRGFPSVAPPPHTSVHRLCAVYCVPPAFFIQHHARTFTHLYISLFLCRHLPILSLYYL